MLKTKVVILFLLFLYPVSAFAIQPPESNLAYEFNKETMSAQSYMVLDLESGMVLIAQNETEPHVPASLTKLVTALVVLESGVDLNKSITMQKVDEVGGARIATKAGIKYKASDLLHASLIASANNATNALTRATGLTKEQFVNKMNKKVRELGAWNSFFVDPAGISELNIVTAKDMSIIAAAAFNNPTIKKITQMPRFVLRSTNNTRYVHNLKTTNRLLTGGSWIINAAKTGYLAESGYNFLASLRDVDGKDIIVVLLGSKDPEAQFSETKRLALWSWLNYKWPPGKSLPQVAGAFVGLQMPKN